MRRGTSAKTYVVFHGQKSGVYATLEECQAQVNDYDGSLYMLFNSFEDAESAW